MKYLITIMSITLLLSCSIRHKVGTFLNKNIHDSVSIKTDTIKEFNSTNLVKITDSISKKN
jgi:hypothetical protein